MTAVLDRIIETYRSSGGTIITLLQDTQDALGYIPREAVSYFSDRLNIAPSRFFGVMTFYAQFRLRPVGKNKITTCDGTACHVRGSQRIISGLRRELRLVGDEDTTSDGQVTIEQVNCVGACGIAPVVIINNKVHGRAAADKIVKEIRRLAGKDHEQE